MGPNLVVHPSPILDCDLRIDSVHKPLHPEALVSKLSVEALVRAVLPRLSRIDRRSVDAGVLKSAKHRSRHELGSVVGPEILRPSAHADPLREHLDDSSGPKAPSDVDRQALARELVDHREALELLTVGAGVEYEVVRPHLVCTGCRNGPRSPAFRSGGPDATGR